MRVPVLLLALLQFVALDRAAGQPPPVGWDAAMADGGQPVQISARAVGLSGARLSGVTLHGAWVLTGDRPEFGGFSGLLLRDGRLYAASDNAWWLGAEFADEKGMPVLRHAVMAPIRDAEGQAYGQSTGNAEGLAWDGDRLAVAFERDHRIMHLGADGRCGSPIAPAAFGRLLSNKGIEGLASLPGGGLLAIVEGREASGAPLFVLGRDGRVAESSLPVSWLHEVTGADVGPDGALYLVLREYSALFGLDIRVLRYRLGEDGFPLPESAEVLAAFGAESGIDNMEGIAVEASPDGPIRLWLISDDNFRQTQRTLLVGLDVLP